MLLVTLILLPKAWGSACLEASKCTRKLNHNGQFLTYFSNFKTDVINTKITKAVIVIHGALRNGNEYYDDMVKALRAEGLIGSILILSPTFRKVNDARKRKKDEFYWGRAWDTKWKYGYISSGPKVGTSSFKLLDNLVLSLNSVNFPNLKQVIVTGHSAGGQFTIRYAFSSEIDSLSEFKVSFVPSNPSSWLYTTDNRGSKINGKYALKNFNKSLCPEYNQYIYGLEGKLPSYFPKDLIKANKKFVLKDIRYLMGQADTEGSSLDKSCEANIQGKNRIERGIHYYQTMRNTFPKTTHKLFKVPAIGHDHFLMYSSKEFLDFLN
jgi:hypothetical protein